ncbi:MarR family transcriptional regulator [Aliiglaciecola sp. LCG003]|uniref:MarR family winged helix-turn-helix transcriptional regulator n=1 Tax=Aliiglaciecola sp. LCG003 TaxID=3053655 RepID=UPI0025744909|nr:MarR family transcriptional regulator [Aliiglaciecola sp. LCG003]WJG09918.1 MarR family transcriptional regulator [Aliiglaciecola sp. LCG003]
MPEFNQEMTIITALNFAAVRLSKKIDRAFSVHGVSYSEFMALHILHSSPNHSLSRIALAEAMVMTASGITRMINPLQKMHLIEKENNPRDARVSLVKLSKAGLELYENAWITFQATSQSLLPELRQYQTDSILHILNDLNPR